MNAVENQVREMVKIELEAANKKFPQFRSSHEGWAVILEEYTELKNETDRIHKLMEDMFCNIHFNDCVLQGKGAAEIEKYAEHAACEAIQTAAMAQKFLDMLERQGETA